MTRVYLPILLLIGVVTAMAATFIVLSALTVKPQRNAVKQQAYESGIAPLGDARERFSVKFYLVAMLFIVFDIETVFLYPWAVTFTHWNSHSMQLFSFFEMIIFIVILFVGYIYVWKKGAFEWE